MSRSVLATRLLFATLALITTAIAASAAEHAFRFEWRGNTQYIVNQQATWITVGWTDEGRCRQGCVTKPIQPGEYRAFPTYKGQVKTVSCRASQIVATGSGWKCQR